MSLANPTSLRVGATGILAGRQHHVIGRIVMSMEDSSGTFYWNEFNLVDDSGQSATLVYETTEQGGQWRLFKLFEPVPPLSAIEAAAKRVGDWLDYGDGKARITLVDESRVCHIEGIAPEGVEVGDVARYFNAEAGPQLIVVSWTGSEVEYYRGTDLPGQAVAEAFGFEPAVCSSRSHSGSSAPPYVVGSRPHTAVTKWVMALLAVITMAAGYASCRTQPPRAPAKTTQAPDSTLKVGASGMLDGKIYRLARQQLAEVAQVGRTDEQNQYCLLDADGQEALLTCDAKSGAVTWQLFVTMPPPLALAAAPAAALRVGDSIEVAGKNCVVNELFRLRVKRVEPASLPGSPAVKYGFSARSENGPVLALWDSQGITCYLGKPFSAQTITNAFSAPGPERE
jgi:hypothetical protein